MLQSDLNQTFIWWFYLFILGLAFYPLATVLFNKFVDRGYIFAKTLGIAITSFLVFLISFLHILPFSQTSILIGISIGVILQLIILKKYITKPTRKELTIMILEELLFAGALFFWVYIKGFQPDIHGLEKYMDFGFINSILRSTYFPPVDMWFPPLSINYYYFGHLATAVLIKLTSISPFIGYNLMLCTIFAFTIVSTFSLGLNITFNIFKKVKESVIAGFLAGIIATFAGNLQTIYAFFAPYNPPDKPVPFWQLAFQPDKFPNEYWYPNATRFIPFTIHEFPSYSFVVSDLHGHVLDIPFVLITLAMLYMLFLDKVRVARIIGVAFFLSIMYMTNAWDGIIYMLVLLLSILLIQSALLVYRKKKGKRTIASLLDSIKNKKAFFLSLLKYSLIAGLSYFVFLIPFNASFKPFVSGVGVVCAPDFLVNLKNIGPLLFEADHCQRSPLWMIALLYGFFYVFALTFVVKAAFMKKVSQTIIYILLLIFISTLLILTPEFLYAKDIYPDHYRANTMFKLGYQAFLMLSLVSGVLIVYLIKKGRKLIWIPVTTVLLSIVLLYPTFAIPSYFGIFRYYPQGLLFSLQQIPLDAQNYKGIDGLSYLKIIHPEDYDAVLWIQNNIKGQPVIVESQGDSYTDHERISANTGLPTVLGWAVHEWLWRGAYRFPESRIDDVRALYEDDIEKTKKLIRKYNISYIYVGGLEREKYPNIKEEKFKSLGTPVYSSGTTTIYKINENLK